MLVPLSTHTDRLRAHILKEHVCTTYAPNEVRHAICICQIYLLVGDMHLARMGQ